MSKLLEVNDLTKRFGGLVAVDNVTFGVNEGEILGLIGPNGAGKSVLFNTIHGFYKPESGSIKFEGKEIAKLGPHEICHRGIARTHQIVRPFRSLSVLENVMVGAFFGPRHRMPSQDARQNAVDTLEFVELLEKKDTIANDLTLPDQKRLEVARALATKPRLLMLDEAVSGLNATETERFMTLIRKTRDNGTTIFLIEHVMRAVMNLSDRIIVLHHGKKIAEGTAAEVGNDTKVVEAYLGEKYVF